LIITIKSLNFTYKKWGKFYDENILKEKEPDPFADCGAYKADLEKIDWLSLPKSVISAARTGKKVIGERQDVHWQILYSNWKNLWVQKQGQTVGYTLGELAKIKEITKNYSSKK
jgi:hypothetical protein